jgi:hypothetical protein
MGYWIAGIGAYLLVSFCFWCIFRAGAIADRQIEEFMRDHDKGA